MTEEVSRTISTKDEEETINFDKESINFDEVKIDNLNDDLVLSLSNRVKSMKIIQINSDSDFDSDLNDSLLNLELDNEDIAYLNSLPATTNHIFKEDVKNILEKL